jgi:hypothetical protein
MVRRRLGNANWKRAGTPLSERIAMGSPRSTNRRSKVTKLANEITQALKSDEGKEILKNIRTLRERFVPEVVAKEDASRARRAKVAKGAYRARGGSASWQMPPQY